MGTFLGLNDFKPRALSRRLIKMAMNDNITIFDLEQVQFLIVSLEKGRKSSPLS
jgi:hypothetical protein